MWQSGWGLGWGTVYHLGTTSRGSWVPTSYRFVASNFLRVGCKGKKEGLCRYYSSSVLFVMCFKRLLQGPVLWPQVKKLPSAMPTSHMGVLVPVLAALHLAACYHAWEEAKDGPSTWAILVGDVDGVPGSWLWFALAPVVAAIWEGNQWMEHFSVILPFKYTKISVPSPYRLNRYTFKMM